MRRVNGMAKHLCFLSILMTMLLPICGCSHLGTGSGAKSALEEANSDFNRGSYQTSLTKYEAILEKYPNTGDRVLFEMGIIYGHPDNEQKDYLKSLECFQKLIKDYPGSSYRHDSQMMIFYNSSVNLKDQLIGSKQKVIDTLQQEVKSRGSEISSLESEISSLQQEVESNRKKVAELQQEIAALQAVQKGPADRIVIEKKARQLTLIAKGEVLKTYKIALGGNPDGPKERQGDNKTPEGSYIIDSRNRNSQYHLSLHISYPNEKDKKRAKQLGVSPGGDIMIHGMKNGTSWFGEFHTGVDWTKGCIAVTDEEIKEIAGLAPNGTIVEIRP